MRKSIISILVLFFIAPTLHAETSLSYENRSNIIKNLKPKITSSLNDKIIRACWKDALNGSDKSLSSLFLLERMKEIVTSYETRRLKLLDESNSYRDLHEKLKTGFDWSDANKLRKILIGASKGFAHCKEVYNKSENI